MPQGLDRSNDTESHKLSSKEGFTCHLPFSYEAVKTIVTRNPRKLLNANKQMWTLAIGPQFVKQRLANNLAILNYISRFLRLVAHY